MRILLTGSRGYIGSVMAPLLSAAGHEVVGIDTDFDRACTFVGPLPELPTLERDIRDLTPSARDSTPWSTSRRFRTTRSAISTRR